MVFGAHLNVEAGSIKARCPPILILFVQLLLLHRRQCRLSPNGDLATAVTTATVFRADVVVEVECPFLQAARQIVIGWRGEAAKDPMAPQTQAKVCPNLFFQVVYTPFK